MPEATKNTDLRRTGRGDNSPGVVHGKANLADQRRKGRYGPPTPSAATEFDSGVSMAKPPSAGPQVGRGKTRSVGKVGKLGGKD